MNELRESAHSVTARDVMDRKLVVVPQQMSMREAAHLLHRAGASEAPVVDERGRCVGLLSSANILRWVEAGYPEAIIGPVLRCPYQVHGCLLTGQEALICVLAHGNCPFQAGVPTTGGAHADVCTRPANEPPPQGAMPRYVTNEVASVRLQTPLAELVRRLADARANCLVVLDEFDRPIGTVSAASIQNAVASDRAGSDRPRVDCPDCG